MPDRINRLDPNEIHKTLTRLNHRIDERFPESGLSNVCSGLSQLAEDTHKTARYISQPILAVRVGVVFLIALIIAGLVVVVFTMKMSTQSWSLDTLIQFVEPSLNIVVYLGILILFLITVENRIKRKRAVGALHHLRAVAHIIDMHQLTKDPESILHPGSDTASSPKRDLTPFLLNRYLDYCGEMLSLTGKLAAIYAQDFDDPVAISIVNEIENLTTGLSRKIWQKIVILENELGRK